MQKHLCYDLINLIFEKLQDNDEHYVTGLYAAENGDLELLQWAYDMDEDLIKSTI
jgi:hypothetical protein